MSVNIKTRHGNVVAESEGLDRLIANAERELNFTGPAWLQGWFEGFLIVWLAVVIIGIITIAYCLVTGLHLPGT